MPGRDDDDDDDDDDNNDIDSNDDCDDDNNYGLTRNVKLNYPDKKTSLITTITREVLAARAAIGNRRRQMAD